MVRKTHIAIIDDGVDANACHLKLYEDIYIRLVTDQDNTSFSHGTICAAILKKYLVVETLVTSICILDNFGNGEVSDLYKALDWCLSNQVDIVNISLGSISFLDKAEMKNAINNCAYKGVIIVCASDNYGYITYPASFANTIGVRSAREWNLKQGEWLFNDKSLDGIEITAFSDHQVLLDNKIVKCKPNSNSFATPMITAFISNYIAYNDDENNIDILKKKLYLNSQNRLKKSESINHYYKVDWIRSAIYFQIGNNNEDISFLFEFNFKQINIKNIYDIIFYINQKDIFLFDTIIITSDIKFHDLEVKYLLQHIYHFKIPIIFLDNFNYLYNLRIETSIKKWSPISPNEIVERSKNRNISAPIVLIYGCNQKLIMTICQKINSYFNANRYSTLLLTEFVQGILCGFTYIQDEIFNNNKIIDYLSDVSFKENTNICLIAKKNILNHIKYDLIIEIEIDSKKYICNFVNQNWSASANSIGGITRILFDKIISLLSE